MGKLAGMVDSISVWISGGSLLVSAIAPWRAGRVRVLDRRMVLRRDVAGLWPRLRELKDAIAMVQPRPHTLAALGLTRSAQELRASADADAIDVLSAQLDEIGRLPRFVTYEQIEAKIVAARTVRARFELLADKYAAATREDGSTRQRVRDHMSAITAGRLGRPEPTC
jgi:hypothetical protein